MKVTPTGKWIYSQNKEYWMEWIEERVGQPNVFQVNDVEVVMEEDEDGCC